MRRIRAPAVISIVAGLAAIGICMTFLLSQTKAQNNVVSDLIAYLTQKGVPVKNIEITSRIPFRVEVTLQSASSGQGVAPDDPSFEHIVQRGVALVEKRDNIKFDVVRVIVVNTQGVPIYWSDVPVRTVEETLFPSKLDDVTTAGLIREQIGLYGMSLDKLEVSSDTDGTQVLTIRLSVQDIGIANSALPQFMPELRVLVEKLNAEHGTQIVICKVDIVDAEGKLLLKYVLDLQLAQENWWQADGLTLEWFPHPPPSD